MHTAVSAPHNVNEREAFKISERQNKRDCSHIVTHNVFSNRDEERSISDIV